MKQTITWCVSKECTPWERIVLRGFARQIRSSGEDVRILDAGAGAWNEALPVEYWHALGQGERLAKILFSGRLWHFWGKLPPWSGVVALRARTVHTQWRTFDRWVGFPSVVSQHQTRQAETYLPPLFDKQLLWNLEASLPAAGGEGPHVAVLAPSQRRWSPGCQEMLRERRRAALWIALGLPPDRESETLPVNDGLFVHWRERGGLLVLPAQPDAADSWLAAEAALLAVATVSEPSPFMDELLGRDGYVAVDLRGTSGVVSAWKEAVERGLGAEGRTVAARARHRIEEEFPPSRSLGALLALYNTLRGVEH